MDRAFPFVRWAMAACALAATPLATERAWADSCDVDDYLAKAIGIEEPWLENAGYLFTGLTHNSSPQTMTLAPQIEARFGQRLGMELDPPSYTAQEPLGRAPGAFGPSAAGLKGVAIHICSLSAGRATLLTGEVEGQYGTDPRPSALPDQVNSVTVQAMWAQLWNPWLSEGELGYTQRAGSGITGGWFFNTSFGRGWTPSWAAQLELALRRPVIAAQPALSDSACGACAWSFGKRDFCVRGRAHHRPCQGAMYREARASARAPPAQRFAP